ncbi:hypothetical protein AC792_07995 [Arthrobacter sp. RIT-PI-e]|nr:hypothetical protein AC792_07995 [Arthrobacter sp. RIT-PI-e]
MKITLYETHQGIGAAFEDEVAGPPIFAGDLPPHPYPAQFDDIAIGKSPAMHTVNDLHHAKCE